ncbi:MAG: sulfatase-like hydrolase/transferase, partial [Dehalococcoidia bacterium]|nr:sulfatase-like hydrolase/transferase [Dehalococcoidia bacterium]
MRPSSFMLILVGVLSACAPSPSEDSSINYMDSDTKRPNIVVLFLDDAGYGDCGYTGNPLIRTPNIDRIAAEGMRFTQFYSASPACTASRYALLTGRLPVRAGFGWVLTPSSPRGIHPEEWTLAEGLRDRGYATAIYGKWHLGRPEE